MSVVVVVVVDGSNGLNSKVRGCEVTSLTGECEVTSYSCVDFYLRVDVVYFRVFFRSSKGMRTKVTNLWRFFFSN